MTKSVKFLLDKIERAEFFVRHRNGSFYSVPIDQTVQVALIQVLKDTVASFNKRGGKNENYSVSEDYRSGRKIIGSMSDELMAPLKAMFDAGTSPDATDLSQIIANADCYFVYFWDVNKSRLVGVKRATRFKGTLSERGRLVRLVDKSLVLIEDDVFRIDKLFELIFDANLITILDHRALEFIVGIQAQVAASAVSKLESIEQSITFVNFSGIKKHISDHPRAARLAVAVARRTDLDQIQEKEIKAMAEKQSIDLITGKDSKIRPRVSDEYRFLEIFDDRRYISRITGKEIPFVARSRVRA